MKPTKKTDGADAHRQTEQEAQEAQEAQESAETDGGLPGSVGDGAPSGSMGRYKSMLPSNRTLVIAGVGVAVLYILWKKKDQIGESMSVDDLDTANLTEEVEDASPNEPNIEKDPNDPLKADEEALKWLRGEKGDEKDVMRGDE